MVRLKHHLYRAPLPTPTPPATQFHHADGLPTDNIQRPKKLFYPPNFTNLPLLCTLVLLLLLLLAVHRPRLASAPASLLGHLQGKKYHFEMLTMHIQVKITPS